MMTFGIPSHVWPIKGEDGEMDLELHHRWLETMRAREEMGQLEDAAIATVPGPMDIIVGRGNRSLSSPGYLRMRNLVQNLREEYDASDKQGKTKISKIVLHDAKAAGCRFVRLTPEGQLVLCNEQESREKIAHAFRNMRRTDKAGASNRNKEKRSLPIGEESL